MPVAAPADKRYRRAHVKPARKRSRAAVWGGRAVVMLAAAALVAYAGQRAVELAAGLEAFHVTTIDVRGNQRLSTGEVRALMDGLVGRSILAVNLDEWRRALLNSPWVRDASLRKKLPATIDVVILERTPLGIGRINGLLYLVDDRGAVIDEYGPNYADFDLPIIDGLSSAPGQEQSDGYRALLARRLLDALRARNMADQISEIDVRDARNAVVLLEGDPTLIRLGSERFAERLQSYHELAPALREQVPAIDYVDLRFDERVYVGPGKRVPAPRRRDAAPAKKLGARS